LWHDPPLKIPGMPSVGLRFPYCSVAHSAAMLPHHCVPHSRAMQALQPRSCKKWGRKGADASRRDEPRASRCTTNAQSFCHCFIYILLHVNVGWLSCSKSTHSSRNLEALTCSVHTARWRSSQSYFVEVERIQGAASVLIGVECQQIHHSQG